MLNGILQRVYLIDRCVQRFNISSPIEVLHFVTFLLRLKDHYVAYFTKKFISDRSGEQSS